MNKYLKALFILSLASLFIYAGTIKAIDSQQFFEDLKSFKLGSPHFLALTAVLLPYLEIFSGLALFIPKLRRGALSLIVLQFFFFEIWLAQAWARDLIQDCPCFGAKGVDIRIEFCINLFFMAIASLLFFNKKNDSDQPLND